jgi:Phasin protein
MPCACNKGRKCGAKEREQESASSCQQNCVRRRHNARPSLPAALVDLRRASSCHCSDVSKPPESLAKKRIRKVRNDYTNEPLPIGRTDVVQKTKTKFARQNRLIDMAQANTQAAFDFAREVAEAKGPSDLVEAWTTNATKQFDTLTKQAGEMTTLCQRFASAMP